MIRTILKLLTLFFLVTVPSIIYGITPYLFIPIAWLIRLFIGRPIFSYKTGVIALKLSTIFLLLIVPAILYLYVWRPLGWIFFSWMALYLLIRVYSGVHEKEQSMIMAWKKLDALTNQYERTYIRYNLPLTVIAVFLNIGSPVAGYYFGGEKGLWIGIALSAVIWCLSPFARETIIEKTG